MPVKWIFCKFLEFINYRFYETLQFQQKNKNLENFAENNIWRRQVITPNAVRIDLTEFFIFCFRKISRKTYVLIPGILQKHSLWLDTSIWLKQLLVCMFISYCYRSCSIRYLNKFRFPLHLIFCKIPLYVIKTRLKTK